MKQPIIGRVALLFLALTLFIAACGPAVDTAVFSQYPSSRQYEAAVMADLDEGVGFGVRGTPAFFINGNFVSGSHPYATFEQAINSLITQ